jgi:hypothetical protein
MADNKPDFREEAYILEKMELSDDEDDGDFKYEEIKEGADGLDASGIDNISLKDDDDDDDLNNFEALKAKTTMRAMQ